MSVSVLMSVYKKELPEYLNLSMKSIWDDQLLKPTKIVIVKDGSLTPELELLLEEWKIKLGDALLLLQNESNIGLTKSLNIGLQYIDTKYVARMDSDDISLPARFLKQVDFLNKNIDVAVVGSYAQEIDELGNYTEVRKYPQSNENIRKYIFKATPLQHSAVMMRMEPFINGIRYNEDYITTQDLALWYDLLIAKYKIENIPEILFLFRITKDTFSRRNKTKAFNEFKIYIKGIYKLKPFSLYYIYPFFRLVMRLMPKQIIKVVYNSNIRRKIVE